MLQKTSLATYAETGAKVRSGGLRKRLPRSRVERTAMSPRPYRIEFYLDARGDSPVLRWLQELPDAERYALGSAMDGLLQETGPLLCVLRPQYASALGGGLYEFRFQDLTEDLLRQLGKKPRRAMLKVQKKVLFRVFFHPCGDKVILLLGGYDKAKHSSPSFQNAQIQLARKRMVDWQARQRRTQRPQKA